MTNDDNSAIGMSNEDARKHMQAARCYLELAMNMSQCQELASVTGDHPAWFNEAARQAFNADPVGYCLDYETEPDDWPFHADGDTEQFSAYSEDTGKYSELRLLARAMRHIGLAATAEAQAATERVIGT